jgi:hypothetical protein
MYEMVGTVKMKLDKKMIIGGSSVVLGSTEASRKRHLWRPRVAKLAEGDAAVIRQIDYTPNIFFQNGFFMCSLMTKTNVDYYISKRHHFCFIK